MKPETEKYLWLGVRVYIGTTIALCILGAAAVLVRYL